MTPQEALEQNLVGLWWAPCCMEDLHRIDTVEDAREFIEWMSDDDGAPFAGLFNSREAAAAALTDDAET